MSSITYISLQRLSGDSTVEHVSYLGGCAQFIFKDGETEERFLVRIETERMMSEKSQEYGSVHIEINKIPLKVHEESGLYLAPTDFGAQMSMSRKGVLSAVGLKATDYPLFIRVVGYSTLLACPMNPDRIELIPIDEHETNHRKEGVDYAGWDPPSIGQP